MFKTKKLRPAAQPGGDQYTSTDVARICGVSLRQLQWWDERSVVSPRQDGHKRVYLPQEVLEVSVIAELRRKGFSLQKIRRVLRFLQKDMGKRLRWVRKAMGDPPQEALSKMLGLHQTSISLYERGKRMPDQFEAVRIIAKLKISREYLMEGSLEGVDRDLAIRLAAAHPELVPPIRKDLSKDTDPS